jgi:hypothetical protein
MAGVMAGVFYLLSVLAFCYLFQRVMKMTLDHSYRMKILDQNHERDMTLLRQEYERQIAENAASAPQISIPLTRLNVRLVRYSNKPDHVEIEGRTWNQ